MVALWLFARTFGLELFGERDFPLAPPQAMVEPPTAHSSGVSAPLMGRRLPLSNSNRGLRFFLFLISLGRGGPR